MRVLLVHPEDSPRRGPWASRRWDLVVDLGRSSESAAADWQERLGCPVLRLDSFRQGLDDLLWIRRIVESGRGRLVDGEGLDWWELTAILLDADLETAIRLRRLAPELAGLKQIHATRPDWPVNGAAAALGRNFEVFGDDGLTRLYGRIGHYQTALRHLSPSQWAEIFFDKYDSQYKLRRMVRAHYSAGSRPVVLVPSAYTNVSRMAAAYARLLPDQCFLFVATRRSGTQFEALPNVRLVGLAGYTRVSESRNDRGEILDGWIPFLSELRRYPEVELLCRAGRLDRFPELLRHGLAVRDAWRNVFEREPVSAVLCGDDSNRYTRIPVLLARKRGLPTLDFHHGALDGRFLFKCMASDFFLAKSEMERDYLLRVCGVAPERVVVGAPPKPHPTCSRAVDWQAASQIIFFSEPYDNAGARAEEVYRELLPPLAELARQWGKKLVIKLHPFESRTQRLGLAASVLSAADREGIKVVSGPLSPKILNRTWFGITVESSTVLDCALHGIPCCLCEWLVLSSFGYVQQYARFGAGIILKKVQQIPEIPTLIQARKWPSQAKDSIWQSITREKLRGYLRGSSDVAGREAEELLEERIAL